MFFFGFLISGDQRLSASKIFARQPGRGLLRRLGVINAFRHQRFLHDAAFPFPSAQARVINAFRHQRFLHKNTGSPSRTITSCDQRLSASKIFAPFRRNRSHRASRVINAFRHQRFLHPQTPGGFQGFRCDQRLSASKIFAPKMQKSSSRNPAVINAFRHQRFLHF